MQSHPDVQLGKIFIVGCIAMMLFIIILVFVVYINAKNETANCNASNITTTTKSKEPQNGRTPIFFIVFIAISFLVVSTMNLTYKVNYFTKKINEPAPSTSNLLGMIKNLQKKQMVDPIASAPPESNGQLGPSAQSENN